MKMHLSCQIPQPRMASRRSQRYVLRTRRFETRGGPGIREARQIRRSRDVSFYEDAELNGEKHKSISAVIKHLLVGHGGKPCPAGDRPIVRPARILR